MSDKEYDETVPAQAAWWLSTDWQRPLRHSLVRELLGAIADTELVDTEESFDEPLLAEALFHDALRERATDIHLDAKDGGWLVRLRIDGYVLDGSMLEPEMGLRLSNQLKALARLGPVTRFIPAEGRITHILDGVRLDLRLAMAPCLRGDKITIRVFSSSREQLALEDLGLIEEGLEDIEEWLDNVSGMLIVCGPTGSGKTTTLYTLLHKLKRHERNVMTVEDPVEYEIDGINHIQVDQRHELDFNKALKAILRLDPDYLMIGEIRDAESASSAVTAASSGHAVMSTLHSRDAVGVVDMLRNYKLTGQDISSTLMLVIAQRLVRTLCKECAVKEAPSDSEREWLERLSRTVPEQVWHAKGCEYCNETGYKGRTGVFEVWRVNKDEYELILNEADRYRLYQNLSHRGHRFLFDDGLRKVEQGVTTLDELRSMGGYSALPPFDTPSGT